VAVTVDTTAPSIDAIATSAYSWGPVLNSEESSSDGTVTVTTSGAENNQTLTLTLGGNDYTTTVSGNENTVTIPANILGGLTHGDTYNFTANVSDAAGNAAAEVTSADFTVDTSAPTITIVSASWDADDYLNATEDNNDGTVSITTTGVEESQTVTITLNGEEYTDAVAADGSASVTISADDLGALEDGSFIYLYS
jgi:phosphotransferase system HPr-like phosphotransfer protein